ncbi:MAG: hypothetical protein H7A38_03205 [Chlamydiales bacterium]|nr:hypothetical protein [Chlamydiales bacterium]
MKKLLLILVGTMIGFGGYFLYDHKKHPTPKSLNLHHVVKQAAQFKKWVTFNPKEKHFEASFPKKPQSDDRKLPIPGSSDSLDYHEYFCELDGDVRYSVSYTILPDDWLKYGNSLVLGGALKVMMQELGKTELVGKNTIDFKSFPALDYEHYTVAKDGQRESAGTLVLVGNVLYKIEISYPLELHHQLQDHVANFIENFKPEKVTVSQPSSSDTDKTQSPQ